MGDLTKAAERAKKMLDVFLTFHDSGMTSSDIDEAKDALADLDAALTEPEQPIKTPDWRDVARLHQQAIDDRTMNFDVTRFATLLANEIQQMNGREYIFDNYESYNKNQSVKKFIEQHNRQMGWDNYD